MFYCLKVLVAQLTPIPCDPVDSSPPGPSVHEIFQGRILEWVAISSFRGFPQPRDQTQVSCIAGKFLMFWATILSLNFREKPYCICVNYISVKLDEIMWAFFWEIYERMDEDDLKKKGELSTFTSPLWSWVFKMYSWERSMSRLYIVTLFI